MTAKTWAIPLACFLLSLPQQGAAEDQEATYTPSVMGMGGAFRGVMGDAANLELNPGAMGLSSVYGAEVNFGLQGDRQLGTGRLIVMDGRTKPGLTAALAVDFGWQPINETAPGWSVVGAVEEDTAQALTQARAFTFGFAIPISQDRKAAIGANLKVARLSDSDSDDIDRDVTGDIGVYLRPIPQIAVGLVGNNVRKVDNSAHPTTLGIGTALYVIPQLIVAVDGVMDLTTYETIKGSVHVGIEGTTADVIPLRLGFYTEPTAEAGVVKNYLTAGIGVLSHPLRLAYSLRIDLSQINGTESLYYHMIGISGGL